MTHPEDGESFDLDALSPHFRDAEAAAEYLERLRWANGRSCPHCGTLDGPEREHYRIQRKGSSRRLWKCFSCKKQFSVTVGTIFEDSHVPLNKWLLAFYLLCSSKKGMSALQLQRMLKVTYKTSWFMCHRIRWAMAEPAFTEKLSGVVEADETYIGGKARNRKKLWRGKEGRKNLGRGKGKAPVMVVVERGGRARSKHIANVTSDSLKGVIREHVDTSARMMTDAYPSYKGLHHEFATHEVINHQLHEYVRGDVHTNTAENFFSILKRGVNGVYHHVSEAHLHRYLSEFDFCYNNREAAGINDAERTRLAIAGATGKRLMYRDSSPGQGA
jgi:transposase-like protein